MKIFFHFISRYKPLLLPTLAICQLIGFTSLAFAKCTPKQYIDYGRAGLSDAQIAQKCTEDMPQWLSGQWAVTLKLEDFKVHDQTSQNQEGFNPFSSFAKGMEKMTALADKPDENRNELWLITSKAGHLSLDRIYDIHYNPSGPAFSARSGQQQSRHTLLQSTISNGHLKLELVSPPYGNLGIEEWTFDIALASTANQKNQLSGHYTARRKNPLDGKLYSQSGLLVMTRR